MLDFLGVVAGKIFIPSHSGKPKLLSIISVTFLALLFKINTAVPHL